MQKQRGAKHAAIDIGSNTIHLIIARCTPDEFDIIEEKTDEVHTGESVDKTGDISQEKRNAILTTIRQYQALARQHEANPILAVATEAIRKAHNSTDFLEDVKRETGIQVHVISGNVEAALTFYGATYGADVPSNVGVLDVGGGSTELITAKKRHITWLTSIPIGSGWLHDRYLHSNPPTQDEIEIARTFLQTYLQGMRIPQRPPTLIVTGSSASVLLKLAQQAFGLDNQSDRLTCDDLTNCETLLRALPAEEIAQRYEQSLERARVLLAGTLIIKEAMRRLQLNEIRVSSHGLREGVLLAYARYGDHWLDSPEVDVNTSKQKTSSPVQKKAVTTDPYEETFVQSGKRMLTKATDKFLSWHDEVLKGDDIEAVHKMRVASRRLRAALDAYEACCKPKPFKKSLRIVKEAADLLGIVRDTDVMIQHVSTEFEEAPGEEKAGMQWFLDRLKSYHQKQQKELDSFLQNLDGTALQHEISSCIQ